MHTVTRIKAPQTATFAVLPHVLGISALVLYFTAFNVGMAYYHLCGTPKEQIGGNLLGLACGFLVMGLALPFLEKRIAGGSAVWRVLFFLLMLLPPICTSFRDFPVGFTGSPLSNAVQAALWGLPLPAVLWLFFKHVPPRLHSLGYACALGCGSLFWALFLPAVQILSLEPGFSALTNSVLTMLFLFRHLGLLLVSLLCLCLMGRAGNSAAGEEPAADSREPFRLGPFLLIFVPVLLCCFLNGFSGFRFSGRITFIDHSAILHLLLAFLFPIAGWAVSRREAVLPGMLAAVILWYSLTPFLLFLFNSGQFGVAVSLLCDISGQMLIFSATLAGARFAGAWRCRFPVLVCVCAYLAFAVIAGGRIAAVRLHDLSPEFVAPALYLLALCCAFSVFPLCRAFPAPLPEPAAQASESEEKQRAFTVAFALSKRETEVLEGLLLGMKSEAIGEALHISERTVRLHITNVVRKTATSGRRDLVRLYAAWKQVE
jgi:DNA-binding CsgD family transcriptional regulator